MSQSPPAAHATTRVFSPALQALVFDFDRTLVPLGNYVRWRDALPPMREAYLAAGVPQEVLDAAPRGCLGLIRHVSESEALDRVTLIDVQRRVSEILAGFEAEAIGKARLFPGAAMLLRALASLRLRASIVSSNQTGVIRAILNQEGVEGCFTSVIGRDAVERIKPSPEGMFRCCDALGLDPAACLGIGDNVGDVVAALEAGMPAVGVASGVSSPSELSAAGALAVFGNLEELDAALRGERAAT